MAGIHQQHARHMDKVWPTRVVGRSWTKPATASERFLALWLLVGLALALTACSGSDGGGEAEQAQSPPSTIRSSGALAYADPDDPGPFAPRPGTQREDAPGSPGFGDGPIPQNLDVEDPDFVDFPDPNEFDSGPAGSNGEDLSSESSADLDSTEPPVVRQDGIELVFADGALASIAPRSTIEEISRTLGPLYIITEEPFIRAGFGGGYSVSKGGEVLFWAIEENGRITTIMATNPRVGLDSGLRPTMPLIDAIALHGEPTLRLGLELREFAAFADGTGAAEGVSVLVAIGQFGGPVGSYTGALEPGQETSGYQLTDANIKELWFDLS